MQNLHATTSLKPGGRDANIAKYLSQMNIGHHCRKWKSPILGVERIVLRDVFLASIFSAYVEPKLFFSLSCGKILQCSPYLRPRGMTAYPRTFNLAINLAKRVLFVLIMSDKLRCFCSTCSVIYAKHKLEFLLPLRHTLVEIICTLLPLWSTQVWVRGASRACKSLAFVRAP